MADPSGSHALAGFTQLWAKTNRDDPSPDDYHALALHLVDVAAVTYEIWRTGMSPWRRRRWRQALGVDDDPAGRWLAFIAGAHDLGKASPVFQQQAPGHLERISRMTGEPLRAREFPERLAHGLITAGTLPRQLTSRYGIGRPVGKRLGLTTGAHHGAFATVADLRHVGPRGGRNAEIGDGVWETWRTDLIDYLARATGLPESLPAALRDHLLSYADAEALAGLISYSDWIGSDERFFPRTTAVPTDPDDAFRESTGKALRAVAALGLDVPALSIPAGTIAETFTFIQQPNAGQTVAMGAMADRTGPGIAVVEYPMGWGKTEIALWMAARWAARDGIDGFYVAMPTRTTSDQLFTRVDTLLAHHASVAGLSPNLIRVSGQAPLSAVRAKVEDLEGDERLAGSANPTETDRSSPAERREEAVRRAQWFGRRGRGLIATYGVGTVDQAMLGVLATRHNFVRLAGLEGRTVIFDKVHSYDIYMSTIVDRLLGLLGALGSPVVILTATLPAHRTAQLVAAYASAATWALPDWQPATYPRLSIATADGAASHSVETVDDSRPPLRIERLPHDIQDEEGMWRDVADRLERALAGGGTAAVICNTVAQAQAAWRALAAVFPVDQLDLFHARFRQRERRGIQNRVLRDFGKRVVDDDGTRIRPQRRIVIATQIIEQSLDLDFDLMVSMFCPVDLLLQRSGRLQRHRGTDELRPATLRTPVLWLIGYHEDDAVPSFPMGSLAVYGAFPLLRSWWALRGRDDIRIPVDIQPLIELAYDQTADPPVDALWLADAWLAARKDFERRRDNDEREARGRVIPALDEDDPCVGNDALTRELRSSEPEEQLAPELAGFAARTRLGPPSITAVLLTAAEADRYRAAIDPPRGKKPPPKEVVELLDRSVGVSLRGVTQALAAMGRPAAWDEVAALRYATLVVLADRDERVVNERWSVRLDDRLGVCFDRTDDRPTLIQEEEA